FNAIFAAAFPVALEKFGGVVFLLFALLSALGLWYVLTRIPETAGRSLEEIEDDWRAKATAKAAGKTGQDS
ncbi:MAG: MFS transporter, partial [Micrococcaceae bacterium]|nr:MFS transporter [Micrococcaceae bacterium]